jgi:hypothetical protein
VLVVPSVWPENSPSVILEAMASGIPVIASDIGGIGELVEPGVTGFLVPPGDPRALAETITLVLADPHLRREMGEKALASVQQHDLRGQVGRMLAIFRELVDGRKAEHAFDLDVLLYDAGHHWSPHIVDILHQLAELEKTLKRRLLMCRADLSDGQTWRVGKLLLIPSAGQNSFSHAIYALQRQLPIVVPANVRALKGLCLAANAGLWYSNLGELRECLALLLSDEPLRRAMGTNGKNFVESLRRTTAFSSQPGIYPPNQAQAPGT